MASCYVISTSLALAQVVSPADIAQKPISGAGHDYIHMLEETVNPADGSVSLDIKVPMPAGRGISLPFSLTYNSAAIFHFYANQPGQAGFVPSGPLFSYGWGTSLPFLGFTSSSIAIPFYSGNCFFSTGYEFYDLIGRSHSLYLAADSPSPVQYQNCSDIGSGIPSFSAEYTGGDSQVNATFTETCGDGLWGTGQGPECNDALPPVKVMDSAGSVYSFSLQDNAIGYPAGGATPGYPQQVAYWPDSIEDRNGNMILFTGYGTGGVKVTDTAGRTLTMDNVISPSTIAAGGMTYTLAYQSPAPSLNYTIPSVFVAPPDGFTPPPDLICGLSTTFSGSMTNAVKTLTLPNGKQYAFSYNNSYGLLSQITYPDGGWVKYTWGFPTNNSQPVYTQDALYSGLQGQGGEQLSASCNTLYSTPVVLTRSVGFGGSTTPILTQTFSYNTVWGSGSTSNLWTSKTTTVQTTDAVTNLTSQVVYTYAPYNQNWSNGFGSGGAATQIAVESEVQSYDWSNNTTPLRTDAKQWYDQFNLKSDQTSYGSSTSQVTYQYGFGGAVTQKTESDFGNGAPGPVLRETVTNYQTFPVNPLYNQLYAPTPTLLSSPCQTIVYDGNNTRFAETDYFYDNGSTGTACGTAGTPSVTGVSGLVAGTHDETHYGSSGTVSRGNLTQKTQWSNNGTSPVTTFTYDETGQLLSVKDPCGNATCSDMTGTSHITSYSYADNYSSGTPTGLTNAYVTKIVDALSHITKFSYSYFDGHLTSVLDPNNQTTTYKYNTTPSGCSYADGLDRLTEVDLPDGGQTTYCFNDAAYSTSANTPNVTTTRKIDSSHNLSTTTAWDGAGHVVRTIVNSDPQGAANTDTAYYGTGKVSSVSNPYRSGDTQYFTQYQYDGLGRKVVEIPQDGTSTYNIQTRYSGALTTYTDDTGRTHKTAVDGLGRLVQVFENPSLGTFNGIAYPQLETDYFYDALSNMFCVAQKGTATSGTACPASPTGTSPYNPSTNAYRARWFVYDSLSRLKDAYNPETGHTNWTYDANNNVASKTDAKSHTINYSYDAENRVTGKTYSAGDHAVTYGYDQTSYNGLTITYGVHKHTGMSDATGVTAWSFDSLGRPLVEQRTIGTITKSNSTVYNLLGLPTTITYPDSTVVSYGYDNAGRVAGISDTTRGLSYVTGPNRVSSCGQQALSVQYTAANLPQAYLVGYQPTLENYGVTVGECYNSRLQPSTIIATPVDSSLPSVMSLGYSWREGYGDNGDLIYLNNANNVGHSKFYYYDAYNRVSQYDTPNSSIWGVQYTVDAWSNLTAKTVMSGYGGESFSTGGATNANQFATGYSYDANGNMLSGDGNTYTYDSENRISAITNLGESYTYDGQGERVQKSSGESYWGGGAGHALIESDNSGNPTAEYIYFLGRILARRDLPSGLLTYYFQDHLGSSAVLTDVQGNIKQQYDYAPYGELHWQSGNDPNHYLFTGKERDTETGNDYFGARFYKSATARFLTPDWAASPEAIPYANTALPQTLNLYAYVSNNPVTGIDPDGHMCMINGHGLRECNSGNNDWIIGRDMDETPGSDSGQQSGNSTQQPNNQSGQANQPSNPNQPPPSWDKTKPLPKDPSGLGPDWKKNPKYKNPNGAEYVNDKTGEKIEWNQGRPGPWPPTADRGKDGWHYTPPGGQRGPQMDPGAILRTTVKVGFWGTAAAITFRLFQAFSLAADE